MLIYIVTSGAEFDPYVIHIGTVVPGMHGTLLEYINIPTIQFQSNRTEFASIQSHHSVVCACSKLIEKGWL